jgi:hypothetical protein
MPYVPLPSYQVPAGINYEPVNNAFAQIGNTNQRNALMDFERQKFQAENTRADKQLAIQQQQAADSHRANDLDFSSNLARQSAGIAQAAIAERDPAKKAGMMTQLYALHPEYKSRLAQAGVDPNDFDGTANFIVSQAKGYQNPLDVKLKEAQLAGAQTENAVRGKSWGVTGQNVYGQPTYGMVDLTKPNGGMPAAQPQQAAAGSLPPGQGPSGDDYLKSLPKPMADQVKAIAEGRIPIPGGFALKTPYWQQMMTHVSQYDPSFDAVNYNSRAKTRNDFTSGKSAQNITSFNTAIGHLDELDHAIDGLGNSDYMPVNAASNATAGVNADRAKKLAAFGTARNAVVEELTRAFKGTGGSLTEVQGWEHLLDPNASPAALKQAVKTAVNLLASRIDSVGEQYNKGMGTTSDPVKLLTPKAQKLWLRLNGGEQAPTPDASGIPRPTVPQVGEVRDGFSFKGGNPGDRNSWEAVQ